MVRVDAELHKSSCYLRVNVVTFLAAVVDIVA